MPIPGGIGVREHSAAHVSLSSVFSCQRTDIADAVSWPGSLLASGPSSVAHAALLNSVQLSRNSEANFFVASSVAAVVGEAYIVGGAPKCQQRFRTFLNFLRRSRQTRRERCVSPVVDKLYVVIRRFKDKTGSRNRRSAGLFAAEVRALRSRSSLSSETAGLNPWAGRRAGGA